MYKIQICRWTRDSKTSEPTNKRIAASIAIHIPSNDERQMQLRTIQSDDKTQYSREQVRSQKGNSGTYTWSHPYWISTSAKTKRSKHSGKDPSNGSCAREKKEGTQLGLHTRTCIKFQVRILRIDIHSSDQVPGAMFLHLLWLRRRERDFIVHSRASLPMMSESDLTPEEPKAIQSHRIHQLLSLQMVRQKKQQHVSVIWTCLFKFNLGKHHQRYLRWENCAKTKVNSHQ